MCWSESKLKLQITSYLPIWQNPVDGREEFPNQSLG